MVKRIKSQAFRFMLTLAAGLALVAGAVVLQAPAAAAIPDSCEYKNVCLYDGTGTDWGGPHAHDRYYNYTYVFDYFNDGQGLNDDVSSIYDADPDWKVRLFKDYGYDGSRITSLKGYSYWSSLTTLNNELSSHCWNDGGQADVDEHCDSF